MKMTINKWITTFLLLFGIALQGGCMSFGTLYCAEYPADWVADLVREGAVWRLITLKAAEPTWDDVTAISLSLHRRGTWLVHVGGGQDVWSYLGAKREANLLSGSKRRDEIYYFSRLRNREDIQENIAIAEDRALTVYEDSDGAVFARVEIDLDRIFERYPKCRMIWLDDGVEGMRYVRGEAYRRVKPASETILGSVINEYHKVAFQSADYATFCRFLDTLK